MKKILAVLFMFVVSPIWAANDFSYGLRAYNANEFEIARQTWLPLALQDNDKRAQYYLGQIYSAGVGVPLDNVQAITWYKMAAVQHHEKAQRRLGMMYKRGLGAKKDVKKAFKWYLKAAKQADVIAQYEVAFFYAQGLGVEKDIAEAYKWWGIAALWGDPEAHIERNKITRQLSSAEEQSLVRIINAWKPQKP